MIDSYLRLNAEEEEIFKAEIAKFEAIQQEFVMEIVTSWMEAGIERGKQEGFSKDYKKESWQSLCVYLRGVLVQLSLR